MYWRIKNIILTLIFVCSLGLPGYGQGYERAGWEAQLSTLAHEVSGTVRIVDHNTLEVEGFNYDGGGPAVYFYLGQTNTHDSFVTGIEIGPLLTGTVFEDAQLTVELPNDVDLDQYNAISVWCVDFSVANNYDLIRQ